MGLNKIFVIDLETGQSIKAIDIFEQPAGIAVDPKVGTIFVTSRQKQSVEMMDANFKYLGTFLKEDLGPIGLCVRGNYLYVANNYFQNILKVEFK